MKYAAIIVSLAIGAFALPQDASTITSAPASAASAGLTPQQSCAVACDPADVNCKASCLGIAHPNSSQAVETTECAEKCDQGDGSPEATEKYSECVQGCIASYFPSSQTVQVGAAASSAAASLTGSAASAASSGASHAASGTGSQATGTGTPSGSAAAASGTGAANLNSVQMAGAGVVGLVMAIFAL
ncbi:hypothetical protein K491DRAFT_672800 [Lophiostoma macrostomum CBS 122681]|uniref:Extracellular membrane protein CFEM domain-containing protein n=1 Tax=Lophiostoma macrostomum CBS 122681 TaxID=1314788 RepID=A0A6A6TVU5_9PLEO|nr:hypothetical protein K491DRAFT_672800 [Lophiostoma macrostomum CBS 122681]